MNAGKELAELIRAARARLGLTGDEFGELFGIRGNQVSRWEREQALPSRKRVAQLAEVCKRSEDEVSDLITRAVAEHRQARQDMLMTITKALADLAHAVDDLSRRLDCLESEVRGSGASNGEPT